MTCSKLSRVGLLLVAVSCLLGCLESSDKKKRVAGTNAPLSHPSADTGIVEGVVIMEGDPASTQEGLAARIPNDCPDAMKNYGLVFREGPGRTAADVFVGVTGYQGRAGEKTDVIPVTARGCAWDRRTYGLFAKQHLMVKSADERPYVPALFGSKTAASLVAVPHGDAVPVFTKGPGMYVLVDEMRNFTQATVLVVDYSTFDVTGLDGKFHIEGVPIGVSKVSAYLPTANLTVEQKITVTKNTTTRVELKLRFDATAYAAAATASAASARMPAKPTQ